MKLISVLLVFLAQIDYGQHTFSIVAVDSLTGEVGGAAATCFETVLDIVDVYPGKGIIFTQSYVNYENQKRAGELFLKGFSPREILDTMALPWVDNEGKPYLRQYAIASLEFGEKTFAFSGDSCFASYGHRIGANYAIAGNILLNDSILPKMEMGFLSCNGSLADKLMNALEAVKIPGADKRCLTNGVSALSACLIVAAKDDNKESPGILINVENVNPLDPITVLKEAFLSKKAAGSIND